MRIEPRRALPKSMRSYHRVGQASRCRRRRRRRRRRPQICMNYINNYSHQSDSCQSCNNSLAHLFLIRFGGPEMAWKPESRIEAPKHVTTRTTSQTNVNNPAIEKPAPMLNGLCMAPDDSRRRDKTSGWIIVSATSVFAHCVTWHAIRRQRRPR